jgi:hypothetical protein
MTHGSPKVDRQFKFDSICTRPQDDFHKYTGAQIVFVEGKREG